MMVVNTIKSNYEKSVIVGQTGAQTDAGQSDPYESV